MGGKLTLGPLVSVILITSGMFHKRNATDFQLIDPQLLDSSSSDIQPSDHDDPGRKRPNSQRTDPSCNQSQATYAD
jgi:hypothetical protein